MSDREIAIDPQTIAPLEGTVLAVQANFYQVQLDPKHPDIPHGVSPFLLCTRRSRLKKIGQKVMVGDRAIVEEPDWEGGRGAISQVLPRKSELDRPPIANVDRILLVFALVDPPLETYQLSRFLVKAESTGLEVGLCLNKIDLVTPDVVDRWCHRLQQWGYDPQPIGVSTGEGLTELSRQFADKITVVSGPSGVGKSSLIDRLIPSVRLRTAPVSGKLGRGRHTTRHVELFELPKGGLLADTPGFNQPDFSCEPSEFAGYFPEAQTRLSRGRCQFSNCLHRDEPNCVVAGDWERYEHYLDFVNEAISRQEMLQQLGEKESNFKRKMTGAGKSEYEPKLASKKYRRQSRRWQHQNLQELCEDLEEV